MNLRQLSLRNFKCFPSLDLPLANLTVLTGFNAAGKSTALQPLLLLSQSLRNSPARVVSIALNGENTALGTIGEISSLNAVGQLCFSFISDDESISWDLKPSEVLGNHFVDVNEMRYFGPNRNVTGSELCPPDIDKTAIIAALHDLVFISPIRDVKSDAYPSPRLSNRIPGNVGSAGEYAAWWYTQCADDEVPSARRHPEDETTTVRGQIDAWLGELFPKATVNAETIAKTSLARLEFRTGSSNWHRPANVGYGLTYVFPLLIALLTAKPRQIIVVDSPEGHLHPKAQSTMGEMLAYFAASGLQIIVESHSDHLLSGIRRGVK